MVSGVPSFVNIDEHIICHIIENCAPYDVMLNRDDVLGIMEIWERATGTSNRWLHFISLSRHTQSVTESEEEAFQTRNPKTMPPASPWRVQGMLHRHLRQTPRCTEHWQIWPRIGQEFYTQKSFLDTLSDILDKCWHFSLIKIRVGLRNPSQVTLGFKMLSLVLIKNCNSCVSSNIYLSSCLSVCLSESSERPGRWTNPHQIWYGDLTLQGSGHRLCFGPRGVPPGSGGP